MRASDCASSTKRGRRLFRFGKTPTSRKNAAEVSLPRSAPATAAGQHRAAPPRLRWRSQLFQRAGLSRDRDADPDQVDARRGARLPRPQPRASGRILRVAAVAADLQADPDDRGHGPYVQFARCFRDEDQRADRQLEFTQVDLEMSFATARSGLRMVEGALAAAFTAIGVDVSPAVPPDAATRRRSRNTGPTSPICALVSRFRTSARCLRSRPSASSARRSNMAVPCAASSFRLREIFATRARRARRSGEAVRRGRPRLGTRRQTACRPRRRQSAKRGFARCSNASGAGG